MFSITVKDIFEPTVLRKKADEFLLFLKALSLETNLWVTQGDFTVKKCKIGKRNLSSPENRLGRNEVWCAKDNHSYMRHICAKGFLHSSFNQVVIDKISLFHEIAPDFTYSQKSFFKYNWNFLDQLLLPYKVNIFTKIIFFKYNWNFLDQQLQPYKSLWQGHVRNTLFHFCKLWVVNKLTVCDAIWEIPSDVAKWHFEKWLG